MDGAWRTIAAWRPTWMVRASAAIEALNHHPEWTNVYNKVKVVLRTHDAGNTVTDKDRELAALLDGVS